jgi:SPP1 family predicted phage head-tail adaptor
MLDAGRLDRRIRLERASTSTNDFNEVVRTWALLAEVWARWMPVRDEERWQAGQIGATVTDRFQIRWRAFTPPLGPTDRLIYEGRTYEIHGVKELGRRQGFEITAAASVP